MRPCTQKPELYSGNYVEPRPFNGDLIDEYTTYYAVDATRFASGVGVDNAASVDRECTEQINSLSLMQGTVIGILLVFTVLCIAIIVILMRRRRREENNAMRRNGPLSDSSLQFDKPPQYSRDDYEHFHAFHDDGIVSTLLPLPFNSNQHILAQ